MGDDDDRLALPLHPPEDAEELFDLLRCKYRGRLVKNEEIGVAVKGLEQLNSLLLPDGEIFDQRSWVDVQPKIVR